MLYQAGGKAYSERLLNPMLGLGFTRQERSILRDLPGLESAGAIG